MISWLRHLGQTLTVPRTAVFLVGVAAAAFALRVGFTVAYRGSLAVAPDRAFGADPVEYDLLARRVAAGAGYTWESGRPTAFRAPGLPLFLAAVYSVAGTSYPAAYLALAGLGAAAAVGTYLFARQVLDEARARWAAVLAAVYPPDVFSCSYIYSETLFAACLAFGLWLVERCARSGRSRDAAGAGVLLGFATLTRSFGLLFLPVFGLYLLAGRPRRVWPAVAFGVGFVAVVGPWTARNYAALGHPVLVATNGGSTFYGANNDVVFDDLKFRGDWVSTRRLPGRDLIDAQPDEVSHDRMEYQLGAEWVRDHPGRFAQLVAFKVVRFWLPFASYPSLKQYPVVNVLTTAPFLLLILVGLARTLARPADRRAFAVAHLVLATNLVMVVLFWGGPRFRDANLPVLMAYAAAGSWWLTPARPPSPPRETSA